MERNENGFSGVRGARSGSQSNGRCAGTGEPWGGMNGNGTNGGMNGMQGNGMNGGMNGNGNNGGNVGGVTDSQNGGCLGGEGIGCSSRQLAMVYSPHQCWRMLYSPSEALGHGTLFEELYKPLEGYSHER